MEVLSIIFSGIAAIEAFISVLISIRHGYSTIISSKRFDWMNDIRNIISQFIEVYFDAQLSNEIKLKKLTMKKHEIELYIDSRNSAEYDNSDHLAIATALEFCINSVNSDETTQSECIKKLIHNVQVCLANTHLRAKGEAETYKKHF